MDLTPSAEFLQWDLPHDDSGKCISIEEMKEQSTFQLRGNENSIIFHYTRGGLESYNYSKLT